MSGRCRSSKTTSGCSFSARGHTFFARHRGEVSLDAEHRQHRTRRAEVGEVVLDVEHRARRGLRVDGFPRRVVESDEGSGVRGARPANTLPCPRLGDAERAAHRFGQPPRQRESEPVPSTSVLGAEPLERHEQLRESRRRCPWPGVAARRSRKRGAVAASSDATVPPGRLYLTAFDEQVEQHLQEPLPVGDDEVSSPRLATERDAVLRPRAAAQSTPPRSVFDADRLERERELARLDPRDVEHLVDQLEQVPAGAENLARRCRPARRRARRARAAARSRGSRSSACAARGSCGEEVALRAVRSLGLLLRAAQVARALGDALLEHLAWRRSRS